MAGVPGARDDFDPSAPMKEAAMFYGLFLRGHPVESLRRDIDVPKAILEKWMRPHRHESGFRESLKRIYYYRKQVLAIFDELVLNERNRARLQ
jgi:transposase-like protein